MNEAELVDTALAVLAEVSPDPQRGAAALAVTGRGQEALSPAAAGRPLSGRRSWERCRAPPGFPVPPLRLPEATRAGAAALVPRQPRRAVRDKPSVPRGPARGVPRGAGLPSPPALGAKPRTAGSVCFPFGQKLQREEGGEKAWSRREEEQELPLTPGEAPGSTASTGVGSDRGAALPATPGAGADAERTGWEDSQDDVLKYVREIFFS